MATSQDHVTTIIRRKLPTTAKPSSSSHIDQSAFISLETSRNRRRRKPPPLFAIPAFISNFTALIRNNNTHNSQTSLLVPKRPSPVRLAPFVVVRPPRPPPTNDVDSATAPIESTSSDTIPTSNDVVNEHAIDETPRIAARNRRHRLRRPMNAFFLFAKEERAALWNQHRNCRNGDISRLLGVKWRAMSYGERRPFVERAKQESARYREKKEGGGGQC